MVAASGCKRNWRRSEMTSGSRTRTATARTEWTGRRCGSGRPSCSRTRPVVEVAKIQERKLSVRDKVAIERDDKTVATVHKALVGIRDRFAIDVDGGADLKAHGNIVDHEYEIERDGEPVAQISKKWFRVRDSYGIEIGAGEDEALILAAVVALESLTD